MVCNEYAFPFLSGVLPPASQAGWRGGHTESSDTSAQVESCKRNPCPLCNCTLDSVWALKDHLARRHDMKVHKCVFCGAKFREVEQMAVHMSKRHGEKLAAGEARGLPSSHSYIPVEVHKHSVFTSGADVDPKSHNNGGVDCAAEDVASDEGFSLLFQVTPTNLHATSRQVSRCDYCGSVFRNAESARKHVLKMHRNDLSQGRGLSMVEPMVEPVVCGGWTPSTCTTSSPQIEQLHQHSMKSEDLT
ncbi:hypothetical protein C7M84_006916 [Penaeus vannamei]|uniref:C2H2-type domain-containing protein n=1 Tax=Penaeus vannamei TaxID=6689 RepID=A0A3R7M6T5_PENVA|nr:hypothetical protein C7M84_006916 [Penaeus vannamei]